MKPARHHCFVGLALLFIMGSAVRAEGLRVESPEGLLDVYAENRTHGIPNFVTTDLLVVGYSLVRQRTLGEAERTNYLPLLRRVISGLSSELACAHDSEVTRANRDYLAVLAALLAGRAEVSGAGDETRAQAELDAVLAADGIRRSPLWQRAVDYSQFVPRGRYAGNPDLEGYFRASRYAGSMLFVVRESAATGVDAALADRLIDQALQLARFLGAAGELGDAYRSLDEELGWSFGPPEDLTLADLSDAQRGVGNEPAAIRARLLEMARSAERQPRILDSVVDRSRLESGLAPQDVMTGWRLLPSRYRVDTAAFQALVYDGTGRYTGGDTIKAAPLGLTVIDGLPVKGFPLADELLAMLGSESAQGSLAARGETAFVGYPAATTRAQAELKRATGLEALHLDLLRAWLRVAPLDDVDLLQSMRAFWTLQRHIGVLYTKQSYTAIGKGLTADRNRKGALLESATPLYEALSEVVAEHRRHTPHPAWEEFATLVESVLAIDRKRTVGPPLDDGDDVFLNRIDRSLRLLANGADRPVVVDVHTNPASGEVLEEATGWPIVVESSAGTSLPPARGARLSHHEFKQPMNRRLTDKAWRELLREQR